MQISSVGDEVGIIVGLEGDEVGTSEGDFVGVGDGVSQIVGELDQLDPHTSLFLLPLVHPSDE